MLAYLRKDQNVNSLLLGEIVLKYGCEEEFKKVFDMITVRRL